MKGGHMVKSKKVLNHCTLIRICYISASNFEKQEDFCREYSHFVKLAVWRTYVTRFVTHFLETVSSLKKL